jgi:hypothetical protein
MSEASRHQATLIPAQPATLVVGDRRLAIDEWPLARSVEERRSVEVRRPSEDLFLIEPKKRTALGIVARYLIAVAVGAVPTAIGSAVDWPWWLSALLGVALASLLVLAIRAELSRVRRVRFDRQAGRFTLERKVGFGREWRVECSHAIGAVLAVQLLHNGRHSITEPQGAGDQQTTSYRQFDGYELNLILDGLQPPRLNLVSTADWAWIRRTGQSIGEFLGVPVIDKLYHGG